MTDKTPENQPNINEIFNLPDLRKREDPSEVPEVLEGEVIDPIDVDVEYVRRNLRKIIEGGKDAMEEIMSLASTMESPRAYEVVAILMKATLDANRELMDHAKEKKKDRPDTPKTVHNNVFVGSTADFQKMIHDMQKK